jgi:hypothetical protein
MNERIKEFMVECYNPYGEFRYDKFAELIVRECASVAHSSDMPSRDIKAHFGLEESQGWICPKCGTDRLKTACPLGFGAQVDGRCPMTAEAQ